MTLSRLLVVALRMYLTLHLPIVCTINVSIDVKKNKVSNPFTRKNILDCKSRQEDACKDDVFLTFKNNENLKVCTRMFRMATTNGIDCCNNQPLVICIATTHFDWMGLTCCI